MISTFNPLYQITWNRKLHTSCVAMDKLKSTTIENSKLAGVNGGHLSPRNVNGPFMKVSVTTGMKWGKMA